MNGLWRGSRERADMEQEVRSILDKFSLFHTTFFDFREYWATAVIVLR